MNRLPSIFIRPCVAPKALRRADLVSSRAFSLVELVVVLAIVGILSSIAIPRYGNVVANYRAAAAANRIIADLSVAQAQAKAASKPLAVTFTTAGSSYQLMTLASPDNPSASYIVNLGADPYVASIVSAAFGATTTVTFDMYGVPDNGGTVVIRSGTRQMTITLDASTGKASAS